MDATEVAGAVEVVEAEQVVEAEEEDGETFCVNLQAYTEFCDAHFPNDRRTSSKAIRTARGGKILRCLRGLDQDNKSVCCWVRRRGFCLQQFPELGLEDVLCEPRKLKSEFDSFSGVCKADDDVGVFGDWRCVAYVEDFHSILLRVHTETLGHGGGYKKLLKEIGRNYAGIPRIAVQTFVNMCSKCQGHAPLRRKVLETDDAGNLLVQVKKKKDYRSYSDTAMAKAYCAIKEKGDTIRHAAQKFGLPESTVRNRLKKNAGPEVPKLGSDPLFSINEEAHLAEHFKQMSDCGYSVSRTEVMDVASMYAVSLNKRDKNNPLAGRWYSNFMKRWPTIKVSTNRYLDPQRAMATSPEALSSYYTKLVQVMNMCSLKDNPQRIFNLDEKTVKVYQSDSKMVDSYAVTIIGCGDALGQQIPPYFVFPGRRMRPEFLKGGTPGASGTVTNSGWSNVDVYKDYLLNHFGKYAQGMDEDKPVLILYDGHNNHISISLIDWAKQHNMVLFILPAHMSHILQPGDLGVFGPFEHIYNQECHRFMQANSCTGIYKHSVCELVCKSYVVALSTQNLQKSFKESGIYPLDPPAIDKSIFPPASMSKARITPRRSTNNQQQGEKTPGPEGQVRADNETHIAKDQLLTMVGNDPDMNGNMAQVVEMGEESLIQKLKTAKKRKCLCFLVSGKAITDEVLLQKIKDRLDSPAKKGRSSSSVSLQLTESGKKARNDQAESNQRPQSPPEPGPSGTQNLSDSSDASSSDELDEMDSVVGILHILG